MVRMSQCHLQITDYINKTVIKLKQTLTGKTGHAFRAVQKTGYCCTYNICYDQMLTRDGITLEEIIVVLLGALEKLSDVRVGLKDTWPTNNGSTLIAMDAMCGTRDGPHPEARLTIRCEKNAVGRYLVIQITRYPLALCEVLVLVDPRKLC